MSKKSPQLRFEGFTDDWEERKLRDLLNKNSEKNKNLSVINVESVSNKTGFTKQTDQFEDYSVASADLSNYYVIREKQFAYNPSRINVGSIAYKDLGDEISVVSPLYVSFSTKKVLNDGFLWNWFKTASFDAQRQRLSEGGVRDTLSFNQLSEMNTMFPTYPEQQKIGSFFKQLDDTIALHQRKLDLLKEQKKGYLQKMFPKNGEKVPELRFEGFADDWEERKLGEMLVNLEAGVSVNSSDYDTGYFILKTSAIKMGNIDLLEVKSIVSEEVARAKTPLIKNSIIISRMNTPELVGASGLVRESIDNIFLPDRLWQGQVAGNFSPEWLIQSINIAANIKKIRDLATGTSGSMKNISKKSMLDLIMNVPTLEEQQKIGSFFKQLDNVIALHQLKLDLLKEQKKGFLQKMFA